MFFLVGDIAFGLVGTAHQGKGKDVCLYDGGNDSLSGSLHLLQTFVRADARYRHVLLYGQSGGVSPILYLHQGGDGRGLAATLASDVAAACPAGRFGHRHFLLPDGQPTDAHFH